MSYGSPKSLSPSESLSAQPCPTDCSGCDETYSVTFNLDPPWTAFNGTWTVTRMEDTCMWEGMAAGIYLFGIKCYSVDWAVQYPPGGDVNGMGGILPNVTNCPTIGVYAMYVYGEEGPVGDSIGTATVA